MSKRPDKPQRYGKGGRFGGRRISNASISAIQEQGRITTEALKEQARQQREIDSMQIKGFERKNKLQQGEELHQPRIKDFEGLNLYLAKLSYD